jgi:zinc transporter 6
MWPLSTYTGRILLQTTPPYMITQLDKCVRECETLDGVLVRSGGVVAHELSRTQELTQSHFWQLDYQRMCGTVVVRVRRDADEQQVLALVTEKLSAVVAVLTVQVVKTTDAYTSSKRACVHACTRVAVGASMQHDSRTWSRTLDAAQRTGSAHRSPATASAHAHSHEHGGHGHAH